jgi:hypothetical protein
MLGAAHASSLAEGIARALATAHARGRLQSERLLSGLYEASPELSMARDLDTLARVVTMCAMNLLDPDGSDLFVPTQDGTRLRSAIVAGSKSLSTDATVWLELGEGATGRAFVTHEPVVVRDYGNWDGAVSQCATAVGARMSVPVIVAGKVCGCVGISYGPPRQGAVGAVETLRLLAGLTAPILYATLGRAKTPDAE